MDCSAISSGMELNKPMDLWFRLFRKEWELGDWERVRIPADAGIEMGNEWVKTDG
jgi:hypothetical protein